MNNPLKLLRFSARKCLPVIRQTEAYGQHFPLQPGMLLDADIVLRGRSLIDWLLEPLYRMRGGMS